MPNSLPVRIAYMSTLKDRISEALANSGKTQTELARACGVKTPSVNDWLSGKTRSMKAVPAQRAAAFLGVNMLWLTEGRGPKTPDESVAHDNDLSSAPLPPDCIPETERAAREITYEVIRDVVSGTLQALGVRYEDLVEDEGAARLRIELALQGASKPAASARPAREIDVKKLDAKWVRNENEAMIPRQREAGRKKKPA